MEAYSDGLLSRKERKTFESMLTRNPELARQVELARRVRETLRSIEIPACPPSVYEPVLEMARRESEVERRSPVRDWLEGLMRPRLAPARLIVVVSAVFAAALTAVVVMNERGAVTTPGDDQVQAALAEVKLALSYVSKAGRETGSAIRHRAVDESIIDPTLRAIGYAEIGSENGQPVPVDRAPIEDENKRGRS